MVKDIEDRFSDYCNSENFEINKNQLLVIQNLKITTKKIINLFFLNFFQKSIQKKVFIFMEM